MPTIWSRKCGVIVCLATAVYGLGGINQNVIRTEKKARGDVLDATGDIAEARKLQEERAKAARRKQVLDELKADVSPDSHLEIQSLQEGAEEEQGHQMREARTASEKELVGRRDGKPLMRRENMQENRVARIEGSAETEVRFVDNGGDESESLMEGVNRDSDGCVAGKEELFGGLCYKKCPVFKFDSQGGGNAGYSSRLGPDACAKTVCNPTTEDEFDGKCYKACSDLIKHYVVRKGPTKCYKSEMNAHSTSNSYNTGFGPGNSPIDIVDVSGPSCKGTQSCCLGYNANDDSTRPNMCPYEPNKGECHEALLGTKDILYRGCQRKTRSGRTCQRWNSQTPHAHSNKPTDKPNEGLTSNYCRNPDHDMTIWCYTTDPKKRFEWCDPLHYNFR